MKSFLKKKFKRLTHLAAAIELEREEIQDLDEVYEKMFVKDFSEENAYVIDTLEEASSDSKQIEENLEQNKKEKPNTISSGLAKNLHRELARKTHPDISGEAEDFKIIQEAYENGDIVALLTMSQKLQVHPPCTEQELEELEMQIENQKKTIKEITMTIRWVWAKSDKSQALREKIQTELGIEPSKFSLWKSNKNQTAVLKDTDDNK